VLVELNQALAATGFGDYLLAQQPNGVLVAQGAGIRFAFMADAGRMRQVASTIPLGLSVDETGRYVLTTHQARQYPLTPVALDPAGLLQVAGAGGAVCIGADGETEIQFSPPGGAMVKVSALADPLAVAAPSGSVPGVYISDAASSLAGIQVVYSDLRVQSFRPAMQNHPAFGIVAQAYGASQVVFRMNGWVQAIFPTGTLWLQPLLAVSAGNGIPQTPAVASTVTARTYEFIDDAGDRQQFVLQ
jgi:hypothetical protein